MSEQIADTLQPTKTVLVVEDDPVNLRIFQKVLKRRGNFNALHSENVLEILDLATSGTVDLILMDVSLNNSQYKGQPVDGIWITKTLKSDPHTQNVPIILVTANAMLGDRERFLAESNADDYVSKPIIDQNAFIDLIHQYVNATSESVGLGSTPLTSLPSSKSSTKTKRRRSSQPQSLYQIQFG